MRAGGGVWGAGGRDMYKRDESIVSMTKLVWSWKMNMTRVMILQHYSYKMP